LCRVALQRGSVTGVTRRSALLCTLLQGHTMFCVLALVSLSIADISVADTLCFTSYWIGTVSRGSLVALPRGLVAIVGRWEASGLALSQRFSFSGSTAGYALEVSFITNVSVTSLVLVIFWANPLLKSRGRMVGIVRLSGTVWS